jgi:cysteinyl-tRNA synthetase
MVIYNTFTKREELLVPRNPGVVKLFTCGPSVYQRQHLGNYRTYLLEDVLQKYLEYKGYHVDRALNFTDVEDKAVAQAEKEGKTLRELTNPNVNEFRENAELLGMYMPDNMQRASECVEEAVELIQTLLDKGVAYWHRGNVYFDPLKYPRFGEVFGLDMSKWPKKKVRFSKDTYAGKRWNLGDFILWHGHEDEEPVYWDTKIGHGRPAWNIQDPAMMLRTIGSELDIHTGGIDNVYRHHDYNRAVMEAATGEELAHYWVHFEHLIVEGQKMSKSKGNTLYPEDVLKRDCAPYHVRFMLINGYYRDQLDITEEFMDECKHRLEKLRNMVKTITTGPVGASGPDSYVDKLIAEVPVLFTTKMDDDMKIREAVDGLYRLIRELRSRQDSAGITAAQQAAIRSELEKIDTVLGVLF